MYSPFLLSCRVNNKIKRWVFSFHVPLFLFVGQELTPQDLGKSTDIWPHLNALIFRLTCFKAFSSFVFQSTVTLDGDKLVHVQKWDGKETKFVREIKDGKMVMVRWIDRDDTSFLFLSLAIYAT